MKRNKILIVDTKSHRSITALQAYARIDTERLFGGKPPDDGSSPIDQFIINTQAINAIYLSYEADKSLGISTTLTEITAEQVILAPNEASPDISDLDLEEDILEEILSEEEPKLVDESQPLPAELGALALLGYMSAVESYFRALVRGLIHVDDHVRSLVEPMSVSYAAALHHTPKLLPEALTENMSFAGASTITEMLKKIIGISGSMPGEVEVIMIEFKKICEIRHCCVHRFGRLGSKTAVALGLKGHKSMLEKTFSPTADDLQIIADILRTFVKTLNNFIFREVVERINKSNSNISFKSDWNWKWNYNSDRKKFLEYYGLFSSKFDNPPSDPARKIYDSLKNTTMASRAQQRGRTPQSRGGHLNS